LGAVSRCLIPLILKHLNLDRSRVTIVDGGEVSDASEFRSQGLAFVPENIRRATLAEQMSKYVGPGDLVIDLATELATTEIVRWCHSNNVLYVNTSIEEWSLADAGPVRSLLALYQEVREMVDSLHGSGATAVVDHGANPGLVSHFAKQGLEDIAKRWLSEHPADTPRAREIVGALERSTFNRLAMALGVKVIHISEQDTQIPHLPKRENEFVNTWSVDAFLDESFAPSELSWGTHERTLPPRAKGINHAMDQLEIEHMGWRTWVRTRIPSGEIMGMVIRHSETFSIADLLTVEKNGTPRYRPTVHYAYCPCDSAIASLRELQMRHFKRQPKQRIMNEEIVEGRDELGVLLMGHDYRSWWIGSRLSIEEANRLVPSQNATTLQVACSALAAILWAIENREEGPCFPEHLPHPYVLKVARPYLGEFISQAFDWSPLHDWDGFFSRCNKRPRPASKDEWQFNTFLVPTL
jgi:homospermidine synthase